MAKPTHKVKKANHGKRPANNRGPQGKEEADQDSVERISDIATQKKRQVILILPLFYWLMPGAVFFGLPCFSNP